MRRHPKGSWWGPATLAVLVLAGCGTAAGEVTTKDGPTSSTDATTTSTEAPTSTSTTEASTTTSSTAATTATTATTAPPTEVVAWHVEGHHRGIEHFALQTERCAFLDHQLQETFTLVDGTEWSFTARYCGTIDATGFWTGEGSFELAAGESDGLTGTFSSAAQLPSTGEPYQLDVHAGTGEFAGASGTCRLENHLRTISFGVQEQSGAFTCDLAK